MWRTLGALERGTGKYNSYEGGNGEKKTDRRLTWEQERDHNRGTRKEDGQITLKRFGRAMGNC